MGCLVIALASAIAFGTGASSARAEDPSEPLNPRAAETAIDLSRTSRELAEVERRLDLARQELPTADTAVAITDSAIASNRDAIARARLEVKAEAIAVYRMHNVGVGALGSIEHVDDLDRADRYTAAMRAVDLGQLSELETMEDQLEKARAQRAAPRDALLGAIDKLDQSRAELSALQDHDQGLLDSWGAVPVMGDAWLTASQLSDWYRSTGYTPTLPPGTTIDDLARMYLEEGAAEHVRGDFAFAQGVVESAYFTVDAGNNYAGIGACDSCAGGFVFGSPRDGVRAQIQLLRNYADPDSRAANLAYPPVRGLYPEDRASAARVYDSFFLKGDVPLWNLMGHGNWATDPDYASKVVKLFARIVAYSRRTLSGG